MYFNFFNFSRAMRLNFAKLQQPQHCMLAMSRQITDFIEEKQLAMALLMIPVLSWSAPVNAPFLYPKSSATTKSALHAPQLNVSIPSSGRRVRQMASATSCLPVPRSPVIRACVCLSISCRMMSLISRICREVPMSSPAIHQSLSSDQCYLKEDLD